MAPLARPENVLKRAEELMAVDQPQAALELLHETVFSKRSRSINQSYLEPIILKFIELAVSLRKGKIVKDGLYQYKRIAQTSGVASLEVAVKKFLELSEAKVTSAQEQADKLTLDIDEDLEASDSPEDILLSTVSNEQTKDRTDREVVTPWLKFLWEAYRSTLDILRNNSKLEILYQNVVKRAFDFCLKFNRKTEFRRLCEMLRTHLQYTAGHYKGAGQINPVDLSDPDTLQRYLDTRFEQLNYAVKLELWQEAFRSVEDVHTLLTVSKRPAKVSTMANYYENLGRIFLVGGNQLFHAAAWSRYYSLVLQARSVPEQELNRIASLLMLSVLAVPTYRRDSDDTIGQKHKDLRLTGLLNMSKAPTRENLLKSALAKNVLAYVRPEIKGLYKILEVEFHPLSLKSRLAPLIEKIGNDPVYKPYVKSLYQVILTRLFQQLSQVYKTVKLDFVYSLATFPAPFNVEPVEIEKFVVRGCQRGEFGIRINHDESSITFKEDIYDDPIKSVSLSKSASTLQPTPSDIVRNQLSNLGKTLYVVVSKVDDLFIDQKVTSKRLAIQRAVDGLEQDNLDVLSRRAHIEEELHRAEEERARKEEEEAKAKVARLQLEREQEQQRLAEDVKKRELERIERERKAIHEDEKRKLAEEINSKGIIKIDVNNLEDLDTNKLRFMQVQQLAKESQDLNERLRIIGRRMDHFERACRLEELELWKEDAERQQQRDLKLYEAKKKATLLNSKQQYEEAVRLKNRLQRIVPDYKEFRTEIEKKKASIFAAKKAENEKLLAREKEARIAQVKKQREMEKARQEALQKEKEEREAREEKEREERAKREEEVAKKSEGVYRPGMLSGRREIKRPTFSSDRPSPPPPQSHANGTPSEEGAKPGVYRLGANRRQIKRPTSPPPVTPSLRRSHF